MRNDFRQVLKGLIIIGGLSWFFSADNPHWSLLFIIILAGVGLPNIIIPDYKQKKNRQNKFSNIKNKSKSTNNYPVNSNILRSDNEILTLPLEELSWREFERLCYLYFKAKGYKPRETNEGADGGVDLIIFDKRHNADVAVQIKHYKSGKRIGVTSIRELNTAKRNHKCALANFITTSSFTKNALLEADKFNIETHDINWVENKIIKWQKTQSIKQARNA